MGVAILGVLFIGAGVGLLVVAFSGPTRRTIAHIPPLASVGAAAIVVGFVLITTVHGTTV